jgi:selenium metabolism protein YedF
MKQLDARGKVCPIPVVMVKKEIDQGATEIEIIVDNETAPTNLSRFANSVGFDSTVSEKDGIFTVTLSKRKSTVESVAAVKQDISAQQTGDWVLFIGNVSIGQESLELGENLLNMFFYTLTQSDHLPTSILFMNGGVKPATQNPQIIQHLEVLAEKGCEILLCGTCLNYFELGDQVKIGKVSNMYEIATRMFNASKIIQF